MYIIPGQGQTTPWGQMFMSTESPYHFAHLLHVGLGTNVDVNRKPLPLCPFIASFKTISLKYDFKHILNDFIHVYSPRAGTDNSLGTKF